MKLQLTRNRSQSGHDQKGSQGLGLRAGLGKSGLELLTPQVDRMQGSSKAQGTEQKRSRASLDNQEDSAWTLGLEALAGP